MAEPLTGDKVAQLCAQAISDALGESAKWVAAEGAKRAPVQTGTLRRSIKTDPIVGARIQPTAAGAGASTAKATSITGGESAKLDPASTTTYVAYAYTGPESKKYAFVQHEGVIGKAGGVEHVKAHLAHRKQSKNSRATLVYMVRAHTRKLPIFLHARHGGGPNYLRGPAMEEAPKIGKRVRDKVKAKLQEHH